MQRIPARRGSTLVEQLAVIMLVGILLAVAVGSGSRLLARAAVSAAAREASDAFAAARDHAVATGTRTAVRLSAGEARLVVHAAHDTIARHPLGAIHGVSIEASRDSMAYAPSGLGWGASNLRLLIRRGAAAETVTVSRLGRVRRS
jgi:type II secretory pathway pseudopilin PulG